MFYSSFMDTTFGSNSEISQNMNILAMFASTYLPIILTAVVLVAIAIVVLLLTIKRAKVEVVLIVLAAIFSAIYLPFIFTTSAVRTMYNLNFLNLSRIANLALSVLRWMSLSTVLIIPIAVFYKNKNLRNIAILFCLPIIILDLALFKYNYAMIAGDFEYNMSYPVVLFILQRFAALITVLYLIFGVKHKVEFKKASMWKAIGITLPLILLLMFPWESFEGIFGHVHIKIETFNLPHRIWLYSCFAIMLVIYMILRKKDYAQKYLFMVLLSTGVFIQFFSSYGTILIPINDLPLQICNLAMVLIPLSLILKYKPIFYFTYFINVLGALIAITVPDLSGDLFAFWTINFIIEHTMAFILPILVVALGIMPKPDKKAFFSATYVYAIYFVFSLIVNVIGLNYDPEINYFYMMGRFIISKLPFISPLYDLKVSFAVGSLTIILRPLYQLGVFLGFLVGMFGLHWVYKYGYSLFDNMRYLEERSKRESADILKMSQEMNGRPLSEPYHPEGKDMVIFEHFTKVYGKTNNKAVSDFSLQINAGEVFGFLGHNGAGKSTAIKSMVGVLPITEGRIEVCGYDVAMQSREAKQCIGYVPDNHAVYEKLTGREFINYVADLFNVDQSTRDERLKKFLDVFQLEFAIDRQIKSYSHGMKQKVTIIAALIHNPKVWVLDEPLTGLDPVSAYQVKQYMIQHAKEGNIVFFSSHILDVVENICDRVAIIKKGELKGVYDIKELKEKDIQLEKLYIDNFYED